MTRVASSGSALRETLQLVAGPRAFARGEAYALDSRVGSLDQRANVLTAIVDGATPYSVRVRVSDDPNDIDGSCSCPVGVAGKRYRFSSVITSDYVIVVL